MQLDWLVTNTDDINSQSHSLFACSREQIRQVENRLKQDIDEDCLHKMTLTIPAYKSEL